MKVAIIGTRGITINLSNVIPPDASYILCSYDSDLAGPAYEYSTKNNIPIELLKPVYPSLPRGDALFRNRIMVDHCDFLIAIWDGKSNGTKHTIKYANALCVPTKIILVDQNKKTTSSDC